MSGSFDYGFKTGCGWVVIAVAIVFVLRIFGVDVSMTWPIVIGIFVGGSLLGWVASGYTSEEENPRKDILTLATSPTTSTLPKAIIRQRLKAKTLKTASNKDLTQEERSKIVSREFVDRLKTDPEFFWQQVRARNILIVDEDGDEVMPSD